MTLLNGGCSTFSGYPQKNGDSKAELQELQRLYYGPDILSKYETLAPGSSERLAYRNNVINGRILAIDDNYQDFIRQFASFENGSNLAIDAVVLGTSGAAALSPTVSSARVLAAIAAGFAGLRGSIDKNLFYQKTWPVLVSQMDALRLAELVKIRTGLQLSDDRYPLTEGLVDLQGYYMAGTLPGAISGIATSSGDTSAQANDELKNLKGTYSFTADSTILRNFWKPNGVVNTAHAAAFNAWLRKNENGVDIATFIYSSQYAGERSKAVADLVTARSKTKISTGASTRPVKKTTLPENPSLPENDSDALRNYWKPNDVVNAEHAAALQTWLNNNEKGVDIATFINSSVYATEWSKAVAALVKPNETENPSLPVSDSDALRNYWKPNGVVNAERAAALQTWLNNYEKGVDMATFINSSVYATEWSKAVAALVKPNEPENPSLPVSDSDALRNYWKPNGVVNAERAATLQTWLNNHEKGVDIATFINSSAYATEWSKAVATLIKSNEPENPSLPVSDSDALRNYWKPNGVVNAERAATLQSWLNNHEKGVDIATFINSSAYATEWSKAVAALIKSNEPENPSLPVSDSDALRNYWKPNGVVNAKHAAALQTWLNNYEKGVDIATFINSSAYATEWSKAVTALIR